MEREQTFASRLKQQRKALDLTQADLARLVGCAVVTMQKIEEGRRRPSKQIAELLAHHLAISPDERESFLRRARVEQSVRHTTPPVDTLLYKSVALCQALGENAPVPLVLLADLALAMGEYEQARQKLEQTLALCEATEDENRCLNKYVELGEEQTKQCYGAYNGR